MNGYNNWTNLTKPPSIIMGTARLSNTLVVHIFRAGDHWYLVKQTLAAKVTKRRKNPWPALSADAMLSRSNRSYTWLCYME